MFCIQKYNFFAVSQKKIARTCVLTSLAFKSSAGKLGKDNMVRMEEEKNPYS